MAKDKSVTGGSLLQEMFRVGPYKRSQGKMARQATFAALLITFALAAWRLYQTLFAQPLFSMDLSGPEYVYSLPMLLLAVGFWLSFRLVNWARFADFLIAVEAEMHKVSWPTRSELVRSSLVVIFVLFFLAAVLYGFDIVWGWIFFKLGVIHSAS